MDANDMGRVVAYLLKRRFVESRPPNHRGWRNGEAEVASILEESDTEEMAQLEFLLQGLGFQFLEYGDDQYRGIAPGGRIWMIARDTAMEVPDYLGSEHLHRQMAVKDLEKKRDSGTWFLHVWLMYLKLLYTDIGRAPAEVSRYQEVMFAQDQLEAAVRAHIEEIRKVGPDGGIEESVFAALDMARNKDVSRRVKNFLALMCKAALLEKRKDGSYHQTLLGAVEFARGYDRTLRHYFSMDDDPAGKLNAIVNLATDTTQVESAEFGSRETSGEV